MSSTLSAGFCELAYQSDETPANIQPILQIITIKKIAAQSNTALDRYRIILSDGKYFIQAMLATQLNHLVEGQKVDKFVTVKLTDFSTNSIQGKRLLVIMELEPQAWVTEKIGEPASWDPAQARASTNSAPGANSVGPSRGAAGKGAKKPKDMGPLYPIEGLSPYQNKWTIKARVTQKSDIRHWTNQKGEGKVFNVTLMDESGEIRATGFNDTVDRFYDLLQEGKVFFVSKARIQIAKKQFNTVNNEYEISFGNDTEIEPCDDESVPQMKYNFVPIGDLGNLQKDETCDVIAIVKEVHELGSITAKSSNKPFSKRDIQLVDQSGQSVRLTLWGKQAESFDHGDEPIIAFKGVKVGDFGGRSLSMFSTATMAVEPDIPDAHQLRGWYDAEGRNKEFTAYSNSMATRSDAPIKPSELKTLGQVKDEQLGMLDTTDYFTTSATVSFVKNETFSYPACPNPDGCNKKVINDGSGWMCEKCDKKWPEPVHRYILQANLLDWAGGIWITAFNEVAEQLVGISANDLMKLREAGEDDKVAGYFSRLAGKTFTFQMMAKQDSFNDTPRVRYNCRKASEPDYPADSAYMISQIESLG